MRRQLALGLVLLLGACASPTFEMTQAQVASLSDSEICKYKNNYRDETKLEAEIARRNLNCDRFYRECLEQGNAPGTQAMGFCIATLRENERLRMERHDPWYDDRMSIYSTLPRRPRH